MMFVKRRVTAQVRISAYSCRVCEQELAYLAKRISVCVVRPMNLVNITVVSPQIQSRLINSNQFFESFSDDMKLLITSLLASCLIHILTKLKIFLLIPSECIEKLPKQNKKRKSSMHTLHSHEPPVFDIAMTTVLLRYLNELTS